MTKRFFSALCLAVLAIVTTIWIVACQPSNPTGNSTGNNPSPENAPTASTGSGGGGVKDNLRLGALLPITGDLSSIGAPMIKSIDFLVETVNKLSLIHI